jgi:hypothetical protein
MATRGVLQATSIWLLVTCLAGCAVTTDFNEGGNSMPDGWSLALPHNAEECVPIDGDYQTLGVGKLKEGSPLIQSRLDVALGYTFPSSSMPEQVSISVDVGEKILSHQFGHPINQSYSVSTTCSDGWYKLEHKLRSTYVGDGATLDYSNRKIELGKTLGGDLIVHLMLESQFSAFLIQKSHEIRETWSKYEVIEGENPKILGEER